MRAVILVRMIDKMDIPRAPARMKAISASLFATCLLVPAPGVLASPPVTRHTEVELKESRGLFRKAGTPRLVLIPGEEIRAELEEVGRFVPASPFYAGHMGKTYDTAMAFVSRRQHYKELGAEELYLDPSTEVHESLHAMSSLIRNSLGHSIDQGYDAIYVGDGRFAEVRMGPGIPKGEIAAWVPSRLRKSLIVKTHLVNSAFKTAHVALLVEELAYHLLDGEIGLENHRYMRDKLKIRSAVTAPAAEWSVVVLALATMLDRDPYGFPSAADRTQFNLLVKRLVEESVASYARGMDGAKYGLLANLSPDTRSHFTYLETEESPQAEAIRGFCARAYGKDWLPDLVARVEGAREATEPAGISRIYNR
jgi:hypothetical protein